MEIKRLTTDLLALVVLGAALFLGASLSTADMGDPPARHVIPQNTTVQNVCGPLGARVAWSLFTAVGAGAWLVLAAIVSLDVRLLARRPGLPTWQWLVGWLLLLTSATTAVAAVSPGLGGGYVVGSGGYAGAWIAAWLGGQFAPIGRVVLLAALAAAGLVLSGESSRIVPLCRWLLAPLRWISRVTLGSAEGTDRWEPADVRETVTATMEREDHERPGGLEEPAVEDDTLVETALEPERVDEERAVVSGSRTLLTVNPPMSSEIEREEVIERLEELSCVVDDEYELPDPGLLADAEEFPYALLAKKAQLAALTIEQSFQEFGLNIHVVSIDTGPVVTQFELELEAGLRLSKVTGLADDLAIALRVPSVRVVAAIPGKNTVGIEVPNERRVMVRLGELLALCPREIKEMRLPVFLGKDVNGRPMVIDLARMPHLLIAGRTGTGKSVCLNALILSLLMTRRPDEVKMLLIDPKMVELSPYRRIPHLMHPVITDMKKAEAVLAWAVDKMEERYDLLARCGVRHLDSFNRLDHEEVLDRLGLDPDDEEAELVPEKMPYIVIVADEMADLMMTAGKDVEGYIIRLAQKSRAVGIHLVLATQKPTVDVITGLIKSNLPARVSFQVSSRTDSRVVLDEIGAEKLLGNGDMLYLAAGTSNLTRAQGTFVSDEEVNDVIDFFAALGPQYSEELAQLSAGSSSGLATQDALSSRDELYEQAIEVVIREGRGSVSLLQRCLGIGYGRAARLVDYMAEDGIVGDYNGSQAREVLFTREDWDALRLDPLSGTAGESSELVEA